ncbi:hypothetical protein GCM10007420_21620 [Glycocaulis albus]|uniref:Uncharacterized protein n=1 Tax=Glycocaulis albus TaxID=1382801 RepID=A0ABQ1XW12_9PROT|nr:hypothetical protein [Glycocaulis albus]GGH04825.1 hypothetical protein GCM10007420_21620 [Glycocaulis albus]
MDQSVTIPVSPRDFVTLEYGPRFEYAATHGLTRGHIGPPPAGFPPHFWGVYMRSADGQAVHIDDVADEDIARAYGQISEDLLTDSAMSLWEAVCTAEPASRLANHADSVRSINGTAYLRDRVGALARACHIGWIAAHRGGNGYDDAFDWEVPPGMLQLGRPRRLSQTRLAGYLPRSRPLWLSATTHNASSIFEGVSHFWDSGRDDNYRNGYAHSRPSGGKPGAEAKGRGRRHHRWRIDTPRTL